jgi:plastocyanin
MCRHSSRCHLNRRWLSVLLLCCAAPLCNAATGVSGQVTAADGKPIANAVVFVDAPPVAQKAAAAQIVDQVEKAFVPGMLPIVVGTWVRFPNHDQIHHHVYSFSPTKTFELPLYKGDAAAPVLFDKVGVVRIGCNIHDWMSGIIVVLPSTQFGVTDAEGRFRLDNLPAGDYRLEAWHARSKAKPDQTAQVAHVAADEVTMNFQLTLTPERPRPAMHGAREQP